MQLNESKLEAYLKPERNGLIDEAHLLGNSLKEYT